MVESKIKDGKIVFVSSILGLMSFAGWSTYAPTKYAVRGLADTLRNELQRHKINIHIFYPGSIFSPGFEVEVGEQTHCLFIVIMQRADKRYIRTKPSPTSPG
jgi:short-subunit dehydrogenase